MQTISGRLESLPRWELCVADINQNMPMAVGRLYVQKFFDKEAKHEVWHMHLLSPGPCSFKHFVAYVQKKHILIHMKLYCIDRR